MRALKALVLFMGLMIVGGLGLVGYTLMTKGAAKLHSPETAAVAPASEGNFGTLILSEPKGTTIASVTTANGQALLHLVGGGVAERIVVLDLAQGRERGRIVVTPP